jgi:hypothetical protein
MLMVSLRYDVKHHISSGKSLFVSVHYLTGIHISVSVSAESIAAAVGICDDTRKYLSCTDSKDIMASVKQRFEIKEYYAG